MYKSQSITNPVHSIFTDDASRRSGALCKIFEKIFIIYIGVDPHQALILAHAVSQPLLWFLEYMSVLRLIKHMPNIFIFIIWKYIVFSGFLMAYLSNSCHEWINRLYMKCLIVKQMLLHFGLPVQKFHGSFHFSLSPHKTSVYIQIYFVTSLKDYSKVLL